MLVPIGRWRDTPYLLFGQVRSETESRQRPLGAQCTPKILRYGGKSNLGEFSEYTVPPAVAAATLLLMT